MEKFVTRAARLNKAYDIELIERELECGEDDIIVRNHMMGICGSDKSFYRGSMPPQTAEFRLNSHSSLGMRAGERLLRWETVSATIKWATR